MLPPHPDPGPDFEMAPDPETLWADLLSEDAALVLPALRAMGGAGRAAVLAHLQRMAHEVGWSEGQARRARAALALAAGDSQMGTPEPGA
jgi:hypothetical protein